MTDHQKASQLAALLIVAREAGSKSPHIAGASVGVTAINALPAQADLKRPAMGSNQNRVLDLLKKGSITLKEGCIELSLHEKQFRTAIDGLRVNGWLIDNSGPYEWRLAAPGKSPNSL